MSDDAVEHEAGAGMGAGGGGAVQAANIEQVGPPRMHRHAHT